MTSGCKRRNVIFSVGARVLSVNAHGQGRDNFPQTAAPDFVIARRQRPNRGRFGAENRVVLRANLRIIDRSKTHARLRNQRAGFVVQFERHFHQARDFQIAQVGRIGERLAFINVLHKS